MFTDLSDIIFDNPSAGHYGVAVTDVDGDGRFEFVVAGYGCANRVLKWVNGGLHDIAPSIIDDFDRPSIGIAAGDIDGDGHEEIYVLNAETFAGPKKYADRLFHRGPGGRWEDLFHRPENRAARNPSSGRSVAVVDRRGTGRYGFVVANYGQPLRYYELGPTGQLVDLAGPTGLTLTTGGRGLWVGPLTSERPDILCVNEHGPNTLFRNQGNGTFTDVASELRLTDAKENARGVTALDADADGRLDLAWGNWEGPNRLMIRQPDGTFRDRATPAMAWPGQIRTVIAADFDNDGYEELFFNHIGEPNRLFRQNASGDWRVVDPGAATEPTGAGTGAAVADIDGDGRLELLIAHGESMPQPLSLFRASGVDYHWLRVLPRTRFGAPARGAMVRLSAGGRVQVRVIDGGSGYLCQMEPVAHFGLGMVDCIESVRIIWPDGESLNLIDVPIRTTLDVPYPRV